MFPLTEINKVVELLKLKIKLKLKLKLKLNRNIYKFINIKKKRWNLLKWLKTKPNQDTKCYF